MSDTTENISGNNPDHTFDGNQKYDQYLDAKGLNCPLPILKTKVLLNKMQPGEILYVEATDPHSVIDFEAYCARTDHILLNKEEGDKLFKFYIQRAKKPKKY